MAFWKKFYKSKYTGAEIDAAVAKAGDATKVTANPTLAGTESALTGLEVGTTKYKVEQPINVVANPTLAGTESALEGLQVGETKYKVGKEPSIYVINASTSDMNTFTCDESYSDLADILANYNEVVLVLTIAGAGLKTVYNYLINNMFVCNQFEADNNSGKISYQQMVAVFGSDNSKTLTTNGPYFWSYDT